MNQSIKFFKFVPIQLINSTTEKLPIQYFDSRLNQPSKSDFAH